MQWIRENQGLLFGYFYLEQEDEEREQEEEPQAQQEKMAYKLHLCGYGSGGTLVALYALREAYVLTSW